MRKAPIVLLTVAILAGCGKPSRRPEPPAAVAAPAAGFGKRLRDVCGDKEGRFNSEFAGDDQGAANRKAYLEKLPKP